MCAFLFFFVSFSFWTVEVLAMTLRILCSLADFQENIFLLLDSHQRLITYVQKLTVLKQIFYLNKILYNYFNILLSCLLKDEILFSVIMYNVHILTPIYFQFYRACILSRKLFKALDFK